MAYTPPENIQKLLKKLPTKPGVYLHKDKHGTIIYVGKAINLRNRVRSYFHKNVDSVKTQRLRHEITDLEIITTESELEALLLGVRYDKEVLTEALQDYDVSPYFGELETGAFLELLY